MNPSVIELYDKLRSAPNEEVRARVIAEAFEALDERYPHLRHMATRQDLSETELRLVKEIEQVRAELKETELRLVKEIEEVRAQTEQVRAELTAKVEEVRADLTTKVEEVRADLTAKVEGVRAELKVDIAHTQAALLKWSFLFWLSQFGAISLLIWRLWP
jgi:DNA anti-recombination protein RmuC